jgi:hypothetical protein
MAQKLKEQLGFEQQVSDQQGVVIQRRRASQTQDRPRRTVQPQHYAEEDDDAIYEQRPHTSARRYVQPQEVYAQGNRKIVVHREPPPKSRVHWMFFVGLAMSIMVIGWVALSAFGAWWQTRQDDWKYGTPRTSQVDQFVGHGDSPDHPNHFIAVNTGGMIEVVELNVIAPKNDHVYPITIAIDPFIPVSLSFQDMNHDGKIDMLVTIGEANPYTVILLNNGTQFTK